MDMRSSADKLLTRSSSRLMRLAAPNQHAAPLTTALGWMSIGLGLTEILAPRQLSKTVGVEEHPAIMRSLGLREIAAGVGILMSRQPSYWLWGRVAGDALDLSLLASAHKSGWHSKQRAAVTATALTAIAAIDVLAALRQGGREGD